MMTLDEIMGRQDVPAVAGDEQGNITWINDAFVQAFGWSQEELVGGSIILIMPAHMHDAHTLGFSRFLTMSAGRALDQ
ncbi:MAG: PAS domain S-box protein, partial [Victivallales bacterium]|nr:PAS domain S-box protein [Victivallales bacterium]